MLLGVAPLLREGDGDCEAVGQMIWKLPAVGTVWHCALEPGEMKIGPALVFRPQFVPAYARMIAPPVPSQ